ncbi:hypothetical protein AB0M46_48125 [Dactylosporangium sp. NPDC051485]|uniref:hypothetical protein n=1 Tax=Dactylosporangium sp. NPDC051485 TaxID=3154846 RepID=UPI003430CD05
MYKHEWTLFLDDLVVVMVQTRRLSRVAVSAGSVLLCLAAGCSTQKPAAPVTPAAPSSAAAASSAAASDDPAAAAAAGRGALDAYRGMWRAYVAALTTPDPASPDLAKYATGDALKTLTAGIQSVKDQGLKGTGNVALAPKITAVTPTTAPTEIEITDCLDDSASQLVRASPGPAYSDEPGGRRLTKATVNRQADGTWKVSGFGAQQVGTC